MKKRIVCFSIATCLILTSTIGRIGYIMFTDTYTVSDTYNSYSLTIDTLAPTVYYSNGNKLTNNKITQIAVVRPNAKCLSELNRLFDYDKAKSITQQLSKGYPVLAIVDKTNYKPKYISVYNKKSTDNTCSQLISANSAGLLSYLDDTVGVKKINFTVDAMGKLLSGDEGTVVEDNYTSRKGVRLYIDKDIQNIVYNATSGMKSGCVVVMNVKDSSVLAVVNKPDDTFINKAFSQYSVGSVFKIAVATCAVENNVNLTYNCTGSIQIGDTIYSCQDKHIHSYQNLKQALANSCNCYFVNLAQYLEKEKLLKTVKALGFTSKTKFYGDWIVKNACVPTENQLSSLGELALFGFGQGKLTASPLQICSTLCTIANDGYYNDNKLVKAEIDDDGNSNLVEYAGERRVIKSSTATTIISYLRYVVTNGTGANAEDSNNASAGKTATAQTGQYVNGEEQLNTWFAGVYPYKNPKYAIVVMTENGTSGSKDCCPIFRTIVENLN